MFLTTYDWDLKVWPHLKSIHNYHPREMDQKEEEKLLATTRCTQLLSHPVGNSGFTKYILTLGPLFLGFKFMRKVYYGPKYSDIGKFI